MRRSVDVELFLAPDIRTGGSVLRSISIIETYRHVNTVSYWFVRIAVFAFPSVFARSRLPAMNEIWIYFYLLHSVFLLREMTSLYPVAPYQCDLEPEGLNGCPALLRADQPDLRNRPAPPGQRLKVTLSRRFVKESYRPLCFRTFISPLQKLRAVLF